MILITPESTWKQYGNPLWKNVQAIEVLMYALICYHENLHLSTEIIISRIHLQCCLTEVTMMLTENLHISK